MNSRKSAIIKRETEMKMKMNIGTKVTIKREIEKKIIRIKRRRKNITKRRMEF